MAPRCWSTERFLFIEAGLQQKNDRHLECTRSISAPTNNTLRRMHNGRLWDLFSSSCSSITPLCIANISPALDWRHLRGRMSRGPESKGPGELRWECWSRCIAWQRTWQVSLNLYLITKVCRSVAAASTANLLLDTPPPPPVWVEESYSNRSQKTPGCQLINFSLTHSNTFSQMTEA